MNIKVNTSIRDKIIIQETMFEAPVEDSHLLGNMRDTISIQTVDTQEKGIIQSLIKLGWTPPEGSHSDIEKLISEIEDADEMEIMEFDFSKIFTALRELKAASLPFSDLARELLSVDGRLVKKHCKDTDPVTACRDVEVTIGDCKRLIGVTNDIG